MWYKNIAGGFFGLVTKHARDGRTDGQTDGQNYDSQDRASIARAVKAVSRKVVAFRVVSIYWQGDDPFPRKFWLQVIYSLLKAASFDTFCLVAPQP